MKTLFVLNWAQCNDHLSEYPKGTQVSCRGVYSSQEAAVAAMEKKVAEEIRLWNNMEDEDEVVAFIDEDESDSEMTVISILGGDVVSIYRIQRMSIS